MTDALGYEVLRGAIPAELAQKAADAMTGLLVKSRREKYTLYEVPAEGQAVKEAFLRSGGRSVLADTLAPKPVPNDPKNIDFGNYNKTEAVSNQLKTGEKGAVYVTIALTDLNPDNGWFIFMEGSHKRGPSAETKQARLRLSPGDAVVWRGDLVYIPSSGGGGKFQVLLYS